MCVCVFFSSRPSSTGCHEAPEKWHKPFIKQPTRGATRQQPPKRAWPLPLPSQDPKHPAPKTLLLSRSWYLHASRCAICRRSISRGGGTPTPTSCLVGHGTAGPRAKSKAHSSSPFNACTPWFGHRSLLDDLQVDHFWEEIFLICMICMICMIYSSSSRRVRPVRYDLHHLAHVSWVGAGL